MGFPKKGRVKREGIETQRKKEYGRRELLWRGLYEGGS